MKIAGKTEALHVYDLSEMDKECLRNEGYEYVDNDICGDEIWERETNFYVGDKSA